MIDILIGIFIGLFIGIIIMSLMKVSKINDLQEEIEKNKQEKNWISWLEGVHYERDYWNFKIKEEIEKLNNDEQNLQNSISDEEREEYSDSSISYQLCDINVRRDVLENLLKKED